ncbi:RNase adapter RapZ [Sphaerisporangium sp. NPDC051017]|uniref:RapZ C-terminal domain-containing protein n=1 Tax=Sphaerisporangium sp. NPDC051017 TaxID=3154636 RepID=UPI003422AA94
MRVPVNAPAVAPAGRAVVVVESFGYGHGPAPEADLTIDARRHLYNPHRDPRMRYLTGLDEQVRAHVLATPGAANQVGNAVTFALCLLIDVTHDSGELVTLAVGCAGGRHRSVAMAEAIAAGLRAAGVVVEVRHRDVGKPVIQRIPTAAAASGGGR